MKASFAALDAFLHQPEPLHAAVLERFAADHPADTHLLLRLFDLAESGETRIQIAAAGLLKRYQARDTAFDTAVTARLFDFLPSARPWEATLYLLQMIPRLPVPPSFADVLSGSLCHLARHPNAFVRAWAYSGLYHVAELYPQYRADVSPLLEKAARGDSPSVRARLRQLRPFVHDGG